MLVLLACGLTLLAVAPQNPIGPDGKPVPVALTDDPYHSLLLENDYARVFEVAIPLQKTTLLHRHGHDYVSVELADTEVQFAFGGTALLTRPVQAGDLRFTYGPNVHQMRNPEGFTKYRNLTVEILKSSRQTPVHPWPAGSIGDYTMLPIPVEPGKTYLVAVDRDSVRMSGVQIVGGESQSLSPGKGPLLIVAITDLELSAVVDGEEKGIKMGRGEARWDPAEFRHKLTNLGRSPAHFVALEFK